MTTGDLVDSHAHLDGPEFAADRDAVLARAKSAGVRRIVLIGLWHGPGDFGSALDLAGADPELLWATVGVHPHDAGRVSAEDWELLAKLGADPRAVGIGETGLDYHYLHSPRDAQRAGFERQLALAARVDKPVSVHLREAEEDSVAMLQDSAIGRGPGGVIHCFSGDARAAERYLELGLYLSFSGIVTFKNAAALQDAARLVPLDRFLIETDAPFLTPVPRRGERNEPAYVALTAQKIADLKGLPVAEIGAAALRNTIRLFGRPARPAS
jgi:TatD DNase family protein